MTALEDLDGLLASLPGFDLLTAEMKQRALDSALIPDGLGVWPAQPGYQPTYDVYWAAMSLVGYLSAQPVVRQTSSEGTSVAVDAPKWAGLLAYFRGASPIAGASSQDILRIVPIPGAPHVRRTDMSGYGGDGYGDVNTDLG